MKDMIANASMIPLTAQIMPINGTEKQKEGETDSAGRGHIP